ncbi:MAG: exopolysaccharide biosynthesis protein [Oscillospiraceae bacterium]|nr:exopolysaccharide biosynthesis protein [Oscillospiraceae bacterium]
MRKTIHYCWFGGKPLPKKVKQYIKTWKKHLPDFEIKQWNEKNFDINCTNFSKQAYESKKWAFVSDVARIHALKEMGGLYLDTDVEIIKPVDFLFENEFFIGKEDEKFVGTCVIGTTTPNNPHINAILDIYKDLTFDPNDMYNVTSPRIITEYLETKNLLAKDTTQDLPSRN